LEAQHCLQERRGNVDITPPPTEGPEADGKEEGGGIAGRKGVAFLFASPGYCSRR
jgi:hypothetical protein